MAAQPQILEGTWVSEKFELIAKFCPMSSAAFEDVIVLKPAVNEDSFSPFMSGYSVLYSDINWNICFRSRSDDRRRTSAARIIGEAESIRNVAMFHLTSPTARGRISMVKEIGHATRPFRRSFP